MTSDGRYRIEVLGPLRVLDADGRDVTPSGALQRRLLALLVLRRGRTVSIDAAADALWPSQLPADPAAAVQNHLFRLRRTLPHRLIESVGEGYRLDPGAVDIDADHLAAALANPADAAAAQAQIDAVLARWRGSAYPELEELDEGRAEAMRLDELRTRAREVRAEARLAAGDTGEVVAELHALVADHPLRERPRALLMAALAATGRQVEALRAYDDFRRLLADELGIEPSPALAAQHQALLTGPAPTVWTSATRLPTPATSLVGREDLAAQVTALAQAGRLVTLVGPGGVGKTRLLLETGHRLLAERPDRPVVLAELAGADPDSAVNVVAAALGIDARPGVPLAQRVADVLGRADLVMLLDNCEHVLDAAAEVVERLLTTCPNVRVVATSRERLRVEGEQVRVVPALPWDGQDAPAARLFAERARAVVPGFEPDESEQACIGDIVSRLDGLPLAIELAAARLHTHGLDEIAAGLDHRFALLTTGYRTSARHASLGAAVSWSFGLLDRALQRTFSDLSVFCGSFDAADAAAVCGLDIQAVTSALAQLVERSLVLRAPGRRYLLLETLRAFGADQLAASGRTDVVAERHARHQVEWLDRANHRLFVTHQPVLAEIDAALPELRGALGWLIAHDQLEAAGRLIAGLMDYGLMRLRPDVMAWSRLVIAADPDDRSPLAASVWVLAAYSAWLVGDLPESEACTARALRIAERTGQMPQEVLQIQGNHALFEGRLLEAADWYRRTAAARAVTNSPRRSMAVATEAMVLGYAGDPAAVPLCEAMLAEVADRVTPSAAYVWFCAGEAVLTVDIELARARLSRALQIAEQTNTSFVIGVAGASKASIDARFGDPVQAAEDYRRLIMHWRRAGVWSTQWTMLRAIAGLLARLGRFHDAAVLEGAVRATRSGHRIFGDDERTLAELSTQLRRALGDEAYDVARARGAALDGEAAVEHALRSL